MNKNRFIRTTTKWLRRTAYVGTLLVSQTTFAEGVALGGAYSQFDDLFIVATSSDADQNCTNLISTLGAVSIVGTVRLPPATYNCQVSQVIVPSNVTLEGSGQLNTRITGLVAGGVVSVSQFAEVNNLTVEAQVTNQGVVFAMKIFGNGALNHVTVLAEGINNIENTGVFVPDNSVGEIMLSHVKVRASNGTSFSNGLRVPDADVILDGVDIEASNSPFARGIFAGINSPTITVRNSVVTGASNAVFNSANATVNIADSQLVGGVNGTGTFKCFGVHNESFLGLDSACGPPPP
ncbi:MAG: hypothetical protein WBN40_04785 [Pseudomonadales bacterium]